MGREIRRVIPNWEHPRQNCEHTPWMGGCDEAKANGGRCLQPLIDHDYESAADEWLVENAAWENGSDTDRAEFETSQVGRRYYWEWNGAPPERKYYRPAWTPEEATWFQVYETVSEGTPVTPPFATKAEIVDYLVANGDYWDQHRGDGGWARPNAEAFVESEWAVSMTFNSATGELKTPRDAAETLAQPLRPAMKGRE